jgi:putative endonuclease
MPKEYSYVYILTNFTNRVIYTGATSKPLKQRIWEHKQKLVPGFTKKYNVTKLVYYEVCEGLYDAFNRERQLKAGSRNKKILLIQNMNPEWKDLYDAIE